MTRIDVSQCTELYRAERHAAAAGGVLCAGQVYKATLKVQL